MDDALKLNRDTARELLNRFGSPLYVYDEEILRTRCQQMRHLLQYSGFHPCYSAKANSNVELLKIIHEEGFHADAMSPTEIALDLEAGFLPEEITFYSNNIPQSEMLEAVRKNIHLCLDSLDQLDAYGEIAPHTAAAVRINPGIGAGHNQKVITGGQTKFGISLDELAEIHTIAEKHDLIIEGLCMHVGSLFLEPTVYLKASEILFHTAMQFHDLKFLDLGGGFGVPYHGEARLDLTAMGSQLDQLIQSFVQTYGRTIEIRTEPGRYVSAECCQLLGTVTARKHNGPVTYIGTDIGFNVLMRPVLYDSYHEIVGYSDSTKMEVSTVVGDICESGDILGNERNLPVLQRGDLIGVMNAGAYGYSMCSNYNGRLRPAEVLLSNGTVRLIRHRDTIESMLIQ